MHRWLGCVCSPTEFTEVCGCCWLRGYGRMPYPPNLCTSVQSVGVFVGGYGILPYPRHPLKFSHRIHRIHGSFWRKNILPRISQILTDFYVAFLPPNLCTSVPICGRLSSPDGSMCSACSVGHSPHLLCWCSSCSGKRQSRAETVAPAW